MTKAVWLGAVLGAVGLCASVMPAEAGAIDGLRALQAQAGEPRAQTVHWRRKCWWHYGHWHCRRYVRHWYPRYYYYGGFYPRPYYYKYRYRPGFAFHGPGFGLWVGPRYKRYWW